MLCIVVTGETGNEHWEGLRSVEVLAHHHREKVVKILFLLLLNNHKKNNYLRMLHPGNSHCQLVKPWEKEISPWDEKQEIWRISGKIVKTTEVTQSAIGCGNNIWTTVVAAAVLIP